MLLLVYLINFWFWKVKKKRIEVNLKMVEKIFNLKDDVYV